MPQKPVYHVSRTEELPAALARLGASDFIALDTEFMRESTYYPRLCLVQLATTQACVLIDPLQVADLQPLFELLHDPNRLKVLHAARQDLEVICAAGPGRSATGPASVIPSRIPGPLFDTQMAAALIGLPAQIGYADLVARRLGVQLAKGHTRTDWSRRPLSDEQLHYATDDVRYLAPLYEDMRAELERRGRLHWLQQEMTAYENPRLYRIEPAHAWQRLKGLDRLQPAQRAAIKLLAEWREALAVKHDKPRGWILPDEALRALSERLPQNDAELGAIRALPPGVLRKRGEELLALVQQARERATAQAEAVAFRRPEPRELALVTKLMAFVRAEGERLEISPELLATRRDVEQLVFSGKKTSLAAGWRHEVIGERLLAMAERSA